MRLQVWSKFQVIFSFVLTLLFISQGLGLEPIDSWLKTFENCALLNSSPFWAYLLLSDILSLHFDYYSTL